MNTRLQCTRLATAIAAVLSAFAHAPSPAQTVPQPATTLPEVTVREAAERADGPVDGYRATRSATFTKTDTPLNEVPASVSIVPAQMMKDAAMQGMGDVFRYVPGVLMHQGEGNRDQIILRGTSTTADFFVDGVRDDAQVFRDLYNLERVEILKGPGGMAFGRGGAGGVVNRVTKRPVFGIISGASITYGSWNQLRGTADIGNKAGDSVAWRLNAMLENADSFRKGAALERYAFNPTLTFALSANTALTVGYEHLLDDRTADRGFPSFNGRPFDAAPSTFFGNASQSHAKSTVDGLYATFEHEFDGGWQLKNTSRVTHYDKFYQNIYPGSAVTAAGTMTLSAYNNANQRNNIFNQTDLTKKFSASGFEHTVLVGAEFGRQDSTNLRNTGFFGAATALTVPANNPFGTATSFRQNGTDANNNSKADIAALYVQDQVAFSRQWKAIAGLRYDHFRVDFDDRRTLTPSVDLSRTDNAFSPRAGLIWTPTAASTYYASYSYAFLPSGEQLGLAAGTANLEPEKAKNYEIGARWDLLPKLTLSTALYRTDRVNVRVTDPANPGLFIKTGQLRSQGFETGLQGEFTRHWQIYGGYSNLDARVQKPFSSGSAPGTTVAAGNKLALTPEHTLSLWNRFTFGGGWGAGIGLIHQSSSFAAINNTATIPSFSRVDGALFYAFNDGKSRLAFNMENILDKKYFPTVDGNNNISPGAPRNARLTLSSTF